LAMRDIRVANFRMSAGKRTPAPHLRNEPRTPACNGAGWLASFRNSAIGPEVAAARLLLGYPAAQPKFGIPRQTCLHRTQEDAVAIRFHRQHQSAHDMSRRPMLRNEANSASNDARLPKSEATPPSAAPIPAVFRTSARASWCHRDRPSRYRYAHGRHPPQTNDKGRARSRTRPFIYSHSQCAQVAATS
jgi:hypothetical protein